MRFYLVDFKVLMFEVESSITFNFKIDKYWVGKESRFHIDSMYDGFEDFLHEISNDIKLEIIDDEKWRATKGFISKYNPYIDLNEEELFYLKLKYGDIFDKLYNGN